ncbi:sensor histidine kinase [Roseibium aggregatum]|uniref:C4-dicarboxylate transport sensor protein DctB n=1 Tax=Roseibium aggregatum TaxID=187304 RepID=A0A926S8P7_9HYPH|nr:ATP-binding protein [Roseibium aggregatum]MBD1549082.1 sensor histidine kinase [Roseibium aggregatum]
MSSLTRRRLTRRIKLLAASFILAVSVGVVWLTGLISLDFFLGEVQRRADATLAVQAAVLEKLLDKFRLMAPLMARGPDAAEIVLNLDAERGKQVAAIAAGMAGAEEVWFLDLNGDVIVSSTSNDLIATGSGKAAIRVVFRQAIQGQLGRQLLPGTQNRPASYVFASAVREHDAVAGVIAVRVGLADVEQAWALSKDPIVALDPHGSVVVTNVPAWRGRQFSELTEEANVVVSHGDGELTEVMKLTDRARGKSHLQLATRLPALDWSVVILADTTEARRQSARAMVIAILLCIIAGGAVWAMLARREEMARRHRRDRAAALRLERRVRSRTADLRKANAQLEQEVRDRLQAEADLRLAQAELVQAAKLATLGKMSAALSHEYNQPLAAIRSDAEIAEMLIARGSPDKAIGNLSRIGSMVARMAEIARTLKGFSRRSGTDIRPVSLRQAIDEALLLVMPQIKRSGVSLKTRLPKEDIVVAGGRIRLEQVIVNLMTNALDAVRDRPDPQIELRLEQEGSRVRLTVTDNGKGIDAETLPHIFDPFFTTKETGAGLGLGLSIAYKIVHDFSGTLTARNTDAGGAEFTIRLPVAGEKTIAAE